MLCTRKKDFKLGTSGSNPPPYPGKDQIPHPREGLSRHSPYFLGTENSQMPWVCLGGCWSFELIGTLETLKHGTLQSVDTVRLKGRARQEINAQRMLEYLGGSGDMLPWEILKFCTSEMRFSAFWGASQSGLIAVNSSQFFAPKRTTILIT